VSLILPFDTETTGLPVYSEQSNKECQPHLVEIAAFLVDETTREVVETLNVIVKPDGWSWSADCEVFKKHGISYDQAMEEGIPEADALQQLMAMYDKCRIRTAFNVSFDNRIMRIAQMRHGYSAEVLEEWKTNKDRYVCSMQKSRVLMPIKKTPSLVAAHAYFFGEGVFKETHRALADAVAAKEIYFALKDMGVV